MTVQGTASGEGGGKGGGGLDVDDDDDSRDKNFSGPYSFCEKWLLSRKRPFS